jgi:hypothetical protein
MQARNGRRGSTLATAVHSVLALVSLTRRPARAVAYQP